MTDAIQSCDLVFEAGRVIPTALTSNSPAPETRPARIRILTLVMFAVALPVTGQAMDARWTTLHEHAAGGDYINLTSVQRNDGMVDVWMLSDYVETRRIRGVRNSASNSALAKVRIDCAGRRSGILALELRAGRGGEGDVVFQHSPATPDMVAVQTDPAMLKAVELVCGAGSAPAAAASARTDQ